MRELVEMSEAVRTMPVEALVATVILSGFGLAAYAIYAVLKVARER